MNKVRPMPQRTLGLMLGAMTGCAPAIAGLNCEASAPPARLAVPLFRLVKVEPALYTSLKALRWSELKGFVQGPSVPALTLSMNGQTWLASTACLAHQCNTHSLIVLYNPATQAIAARAALGGIQKLGGLRSVQVDAALVCADKVFWPDRQR
jgi:hypothetical protein